MRIEPFAGQWIAVGADLEPGSVWTLEQEIPALPTWTSVRGGPGWPGMIRVHFGPVSRGVLGIKARCRVRRIDTVTWVGPKLHGYPARGLSRSSSRLVPPILPYGKLFPCKEPAWFPSLIQHQRAERWVRRFLARRHKNGAPFSRVSLVRRQARFRPRSSRRSPAWSTRGKAVSTWLTCGTPANG